MIYLSLALFIVTFIYRHIYFKIYHSLKFYFIVENDLYVQSHYYAFYWYK